MDAESVQQIARAVADELERRSVPIELAPGEDCQLWAPESMAVRTIPGGYAVVHHGQPSSGKTLGDVLTAFLARVGR